MTTSVITRKVCFKCQVEKALTEFYVHPQMGDGRLNKCKECARKDVRANYEANVDYYREYERSRSMLPNRVQARKRYQSTPPGKAAVRRAHDKFVANNPEKRAAHVAVGNAVRDGRLRKQPCEVCGEKKAQAHHDDYSKPLAVRWLCVPHHNEQHKNEAA